MSKMKPLLLGLMLSIISPTIMAKIAQAVFAGGNFWRMEAEFNAMTGVLETVAGFDGGLSKNPSEQDLASGHTDYRQAVRVIYNEDVISYRQLVDYFWRHVDPTVNNAQFCDKGPQFRTAIFYMDEQQKAIAEATKRELSKRFPVVYTDIAPATQFYAAEGSEQGYYQTHPWRYQYYLYRCGQKAGLAKVWAH